MTIELMKQWLSAIERANQLDGMYSWTQEENSLRQAIQEEALRNVQRLGQEIEAEHVASNDTSQERVDKTAKQRHEQEPVAWQQAMERAFWRMYDHGKDNNPVSAQCEIQALRLLCDGTFDDITAWHPSQWKLPQRQPLTDEDLIECERLADIRHRKHIGSIRGQQLSPADQFLWHYARAIEAAHGIKVEA